MNLRFLYQSILQITGLVYAAIKYSKKEINSVDDYVPEVIYTLPFHGNWYVVNGGITKDTSHSWEILPQRFACDFLIVDDKGKTYAGVSLFWKNGAGIYAGIFTELSVANPAIIW